MDTESLITDLTKDASPVRPLRSPMARFAFWMGGSALVLIAMTLVAVGLRPDIEARLEDMFFIAELGAICLLTITAGMASFWLSVPDEYQQPTIKWLPCVPLITVVALLVIQLLQMPTDMLKQPMEARFDCVFDILAFSIVPGVALFFMMRRAATTHYYLAGGFAAIAVSSFSYLLMRLIEDTDDVLHLLLWHVSPVIALSILGILLGQWLLRW